MTLFVPYASVNNPDASLQRTGSHAVRYGSFLEQYFLWSNPDYHIGELMHQFSVNAFDPIQTGGTLRRVNLYLGLTSHFEFDIENPLSHPVHVTYGTWFLNGVQQNGPSHSGVAVYYNADQSMLVCFKDHSWPDTQVNLAATQFNGSPVFTGPDGFVYTCDWDEGQQLVATITDPTSLAVWGPSLGGTVNLGYQPYHLRHINPPLWGEGLNTSYFNSVNINQAYFDIEFIYSIP